MLKCYITQLFAGSLRSGRCLTALFALLAVTPVWADHGAAPPRLGGVRLCAAASSVQVSLEGVSWAEEADSSEAEARIRTAVLSSLTRSLVAAGIPHTTTCTGSGGVVITLDLRYLDPETYLGFPENAYSYVSAAQVSTLERGAGADIAPVTLSESRYSASASDIIEVAGAAELEAQALALGEAQITALVRAWLEANRVPARSYLLFAGLGGALLALRVFVTVLR